MPNNFRHIDLIKLILPNVLRIIGARRDPMGCCFSCFKQLFAEGQEFPYGLEDLEGQVRRMLDYLGPPFEQACVDFHINTRAVRTASSEQVRRPINQSGQNAWQPDEPWLGDLHSAIDRAR